jgi:hypothetical protein
MRSRYLIAFDTSREMRVSYQFSTGLLAITIYEIPFRLSAEFKDLDGFSWHSAKYTAGSISKLKLIADGCTERVINGSKHRATTIDARITSIWNAILRQPTVTRIGMQLIVTIAAGVSIPLTKEKMKPTLEPVAESPEECENECECDHDTYAYSVAKCTSAGHVRCAYDVSSINDLKCENDRLREENAALRRLTIRDHSGMMRDTTLTRSG